MTTRVVVHFSCGAASAVAAKMALSRFGDRVRIINSFIADEDADNRRFLADCEKWFGRAVEVLRDVKFGASPAEVWRRERFIVGKDGAPCSRALKKRVLEAYHESGDTIVLGYTSDKRDASRLDKFIDANGSARVWVPLIEAGITHRACLETIAAAGIELPRMYRLGYHNANCPKCPKGGMGYWNKIRVDFPENFEEMAALQDVLGPGSYFLRGDRERGERISLRMLDPDRGVFKNEPPIECGAFCETQESGDLTHRDMAAIAKIVLADNEETPR